MCKKSYEKPEIKIHEFEMFDSIAAPVKPGDPGGTLPSIHLRNIDASDATDE